MSNSGSRDTIKDDTISYRMAVFIFILILVFHGTYFRGRSATEVPTLDWLVLARVMACSAGLLLGVALIPKGIPKGFGSKALLLYILTALISILFSPLPKVAAGYVLLFAGATFLLMALIHNARSIDDLVRIEKVWLVTMSILLIKDTLTAILFPELQSDPEEGRLGMGVTHANYIGILAVLIFWLSFRQVRTVGSAMLWAFRTVLLFILIATISRISIASFVIGSLIHYLYKGKGDLKNWGMIISVAGFFTCFFLISLAFEQDWANDIYHYLRRGQVESEITSFTGRTDIWEHAFQKSLDSPLFGHGFGLSRFIMGPLPRSEYEPPHCHNDLLEVFLSTGLLGLVPFGLLAAYSLQWILNHSLLSRCFSEDIALHGTCVVTILLLSSIFETRLGATVTPPQLLFFFYTLILDRKEHFLELNPSSGPYPYSSVVADGELANP